MENRPCAYLNHSHVQSPPAIVHDPLASSGRFLSDFSNVKRETLLEFRQHPRARPDSSGPKLDPVCASGEILKVSRPRARPNNHGSGNISKKPRIFSSPISVVLRQHGRSDKNTRPQTINQPKSARRAGSENAESRRSAPTTCAEFSACLAALDSFPGLDGEADRSHVLKPPQAPGCPRSSRARPSIVGSPIFTWHGASSLADKGDRCTSPDKPEPRCNFGLRPSQRPDISGSRTTKLRAADRFACPRRDPSACRERFLFSKLASGKPSSQHRSPKQAHLSDPFEFLNFHAMRTRTANAPTQDQNLRQPQPLRAPTVISIQLENDQTRYRQASGYGIWRSGSLNLIRDLERSVSYAQANANQTRPRPRAHTSKFLRSSTAEEEMAMHEKRLAVAFDLDQSARILSSPASLNPVPVRSVPMTNLCISQASKSSHGSGSIASTPAWLDNEWMRQDRAPRAVPVSSRAKTKSDPNHTISMMLEAPLLRDDFYCSVLAYSYNIERLAVALGSKVYLWSEPTGVINTPKALDVPHSRTCYITSIAFSSEAGARSILAIGRADGQIVLWSPLDEEARYLRLRNANAVSYLSFRPAPLRRRSQRHPSILAENEVLLVGDELGVVAVYFVEWPEAAKRFLLGWHGSVCLHARISVHTQQICGISWSKGGDYFATGGNDNLCCLFQSNAVLLADEQGGIAPLIESYRDVQGGTHMNVSPGIIPTDKIMGREKIKNQWRLNAAVKAIAFCPWQAGLVAAGGGSNDRCIHFFHTVSGAALASIDCAAQVTALVWSAHRREIAATFGFPQPEHPYRVVVYSWPSCEQLVAIPWRNEMRALHAIGYPGRPNVRGSQREGSAWTPRASDEGCLVVAASDGSIKFHEIWSEAGRATAPRRGVLGGSDILESLHGIEKEGRESIR